MLQKARRFCCRQHQADAPARKRFFILFFQAHPMAFASTISKRDACRDSIPVISITAPSEPPAPRQRDIVAFVCPREERMARNLADDCFRLGLSLRMIHTDSDEFTDATIDELHASGEIGDTTHLILVGHGVNRNGQHRIETQCRGPDEEDVLYPVESHTLKLLGRLRERPETDAVTGKRMLWKGMIHVLSCGTQILGEQVAASAEVQAEGPNLFYGDLDSHGSSESSHAIRSICEFLYQHGREKLFSSASMLAWVARTAAVPVTLAGGEVGSPMVVLPPQSVVEAMPAFLPGRLRQVQLVEAYDATRAAVARADLRRASEAMLQEDGRPDSLVLQQNLARIIHEQVVLDRLDQAAGLFTDAPPLIHTINAFGQPLDAVVEPARLHRYEKLARKASNDCHRSAKRLKMALASLGKDGKTRADGLFSKLTASSHDKVAGTPNGTGTRTATRGPMVNVRGASIDRQGGGLPQASPDHRDRGRQDTQDTLLAAAIRRIAREPGYAAVLLERACRQGDVEMFAALYQAGGLALFRQRALIRSCSNQAMPPLHLACRIQAPELVATLLEHGADVNQPDRTGKTALHHAVEARSLALVEILSGANADSTIQSDGMTPVALAARMGFDAGFAVLANAGFWQTLTTRGTPLAEERPAQAPHS
jgi:hypothetical protein